MSRFSSYGQADSQMLDEIDAGFFGFNNRFRPDQLKSGVLADSQNGRMDLNGEWQVRKGVDVISGSLLIAGSGINVGTAVLDDGGTGPVIKPFQTLEGLVHFLILLNQETINTLLLHYLQKPN